MNTISYKINRTGVAAKPRLANCAALLVALLFTFTLISPSEAQNRRGGGLPLVRDAEIEALIADYTKPIFRAAGLGKRSVEVFLLNQNSFNAFVTGSRMFINTGTILQAETPNEVIGVFAHETGHIVGDHLTRLRDRLEKAKVLSILGALAGAGAIAAGSTEGGAAIALGAGSLQRNSLLAYQRGEEIAADRTAVTLLDKTEQSAKGMLTTFERLGQNPLFSSSRVDPYSLSHPLPRERIRLLSSVAQKSPYFGKQDSPALQTRHNFARAKIAAYTGGAGLVRSIFRTDLNGAAANYGLAISHFLQGSPQQGIRIMQALVKRNPKNPYVHEMMGEIYLRSGKAELAVNSFRNSISLDKRNTGILRIQLGHALLETGNSKNLDAAIKVLKQGIGRDKYSSAGFGYLARAYAAKGNQILAMAASAEERYLQGNIKAAKQFATRAMPGIKKGSPQWLRLQDILTF